MKNQINVGDQNTLQIGQNLDSQQAQIPEKSKINRLAIGVGVIICFVIFGFGGYFLGKQSSQYTKEERETQINPTPVDTEIESSANWKTYTNNFYHLELKYPNNYSLNEKVDKIEINSPLSGCNPALVFNVEEYKQMYEVQIIIKKRYGSLEKILGEEGGKSYGWEDKTFNDKKGFSIAVGAEMITPYTRFLVEGYPGEVLDIQAYVFASDDQGRCMPKLDFGNAQVISNQILSTFKFLNSPKDMVTVKLYYHDSKLDPNTDFCEANNYIEKDIPKTNTPIKDAINTLIRSDIFEKDDRFMLKDINLKQDGTLILKFPWIGGFTTGGSCRIGILTSQIEKTVLQFSEVKKVTFEPEVFQP